MIKLKGLTVGKILADYSGMQTNSLKLLPLPPKKGQKRIVQAEISPELFDAVQREIKKNKYKITQIIEWGFQNFLLTANEESAKKLGLVKNP